MNEETKRYIDSKFEELRTRRINLFDIFGTYETVSVAPALKPSTPYDQIKFYVNGATYRVYWYDTTAGVWHYITSTT